MTRLGEQRLQINTTYLDISELSLRDSRAFHIFIAIQLLTLFCPAGRSYRFPQPLIAKTHTNNNKDLLRLTLMKLN